MKKAKTRIVPYEKVMEHWAIRVGNGYHAIGYKENFFVEQFDDHHVEHIINLYRTEQDALNMIDFYQTICQDSRTIDYRNWQEARVVKWEIKETGSTIKCT